MDCLTWSLRQSDTSPLYSRERSPGGLRSELRVLNNHGDKQELAEEHRNDIHVEKCRQGKSGPLSSETQTT